jgi:hypothetical protein
MKIPRPLFLLVLVAAAGCDREIDTSYAAVRGPSINGIAAFVQLLRDTGHAVTARQYLPAEIDPETDTVVVFDDSFTGLPQPAAELLSGFLRSGGSRTLLVVLRDSDGAIDYLRAVLSRDDLSADRRRRAEEMLGWFETALATATALPRPATPPFADGLATQDRGPAGEAVEVLLPQRPGAAEQRVSARWELRRRLEPGRGTETLWTTGRDRLLVRRRLDDAKILVLASAAPLLNGGLVDPGNRRLAEDLASLLPTTGRMLVAGSSQVVGGDGGSSGGEAGDEDEPSLWRLLRVQPLPWVAAQAIAALMLFCWCTAPIFGRPRRSSPVHAQDFGHHVEALANLFAKSPAAGGDFARERLAAWQPATSSSIRKPNPAPRR